MKEEIRVTTKYDAQICDNIVYLMLCKLRKWPCYMLMALGLATAILAGMIMLTEGRASALPFLVMILGSMLCTAAIFLRPLATKMLVASYGKAFPTFHYVFAENEITVSSDAWERKYSHTYVLRLIEMSELLFMFTKDGQMYVLRQGDVKGGYGRLKEILEQKEGK